MYDRASALDSTNEFVDYELAGIHLQLGNRGQALEHLREVARTNQGLRAMVTADTAFRTLSDEELSSLFPE